MKVRVYSPAMIRNTYNPEADDHLSGVLIVCSKHCQAKDISR
jgi:hypothetical protein